jgi:disulfide bond formation protein DsbB
LLAKIPPASIPINSNLPVAKPFSTSIPASIGNQSVNQVRNAQKTTAVSSNKMSARRKQKIFGMEIWQAIVLIVLFMVLVCVLLCFASMLFNNPRVS